MNFSVEERDGRFSAVGSRFYLYRAVLVASTGGFIFGYGGLVISGAVIFLEKQFGLRPSEVGFAVSSLIIGCILGSGVASGLSDRLGRKKALTIVGLLWGISSIGSALAQNMAELNLFRICGGAGIAVAMLVSPIYVAEISPPRIRGRLGTTNQLSIVAGGLFAFLASYAFSFSGEWRWMLACGVVPALFLLIGLLFVPESPRWLIEKGRELEAIAILSRISGRIEAVASAREISASLAKTETSAFSDLLRPGARGALIVGLGIAILQQLTDPPWLPSMLQ